MASPFTPSQIVALQIPELQPGKWYTCQVLGLLENHELEVTVPMEDGEEVVVPPEYKVLLELVLPDGLRRLTAYVVARRNTPPHLLLDWPETEERIQRRDAVRVSVMFPAYVRPIVEDGKVGTRINGTVIDLSAGGARILLPEPLWEGLVVELALQIPRVGERIIRATIIRATENPGGTLEFAIGTQFLDLKESLRREITKFVFDTQLEHHRRGGI